MEMELKFIFNKNNEEDMVIKEKCDQIGETFNSLLKNCSDTVPELEELKEIVNFNVAENESTINYSIKFSEDLLNYAENNDVNSLVNQIIGKN